MASLEIIFRAEVQTNGNSGGRWTMPLQCPLKPKKITVSSIEDLCSELNNEIEQHLSFYRPFSTNESLIEDTDSYIYSNQYNMNTADLVLCALCNALMVTAVIYEVRGSSVIT